MPTRPQGPIAQEHDFCAEGRMAANRWVGVGCLGGWRRGTAVHKWARRDCCVPSIDALGIIGPGRGKPAPLRAGPGATKKSSFWRMGGSAAPLVRQRSIFDCTSGFREIYRTILREKRNLQRAEPAPARADKNRFRPHTSTRGQGEEEEFCQPSCVCLCEPGHEDEYRGGAMRESAVGLPPRARRAHIVITTNTVWKRLTFFFFPPTPPIRMFSKPAHEGCFGFYQQMALGEKLPATAILAKIRYFPYSKRVTLSVNDGETFACLPFWKGVFWSKGARSHVPAD